MGDVHAENDIETSEQFINYELRLLKHNHAYDDLSNSAREYHYAIRPKVAFEVQECESYHVCICEVVSFDCAVVPRQVILEQYIKLLDV